MGIDFYTGRNSQRDQTDRFHIAASLPLNDREHSTHALWELQGLTVNYAIKYGVHGVLGRKNVPYVDYEIEICSKF